jgi:FMN hydrolase / 5-amino-6-(5-phospho-D-ribitylamino)uracil phosphatase
VLFDVMGTLVYDPFYVEVPAFFGVELRALIARKRPTAWERFELGQLDDAGLAREFFADGRLLDVDGLKRAMVDAYRFLPGIEAILVELSARGTSLHTLSNYPHWYRLIEEKLVVSRWVQWSFVSCETGVRKPAAEAYLGAAARLGVAPDRCLFVDDQPANCEAARACGMDAVHFADATALRSELATRGLL